MLNIISYQDLKELVKKGFTIDDQEKIMELRESALELQNENLELKNKIRELEDTLSIKQNLEWQKPYYIKKRILVKNFVHFVLKRMEKISIYRKRIKECGHV